MAKKKSEPSNRGPKKGRQAPAPGNPPDRRVMEGVVQQFIAGLQGQPDQKSPLGTAQELMYRAFDEADEKRRVQFANEALGICPDCADAHVLLAEHAKNRKEALRHYEQGVAAGERALGTIAFQRDVGHFWGVLETRPYMRARSGLAHSLWTAGRREEAVQHFQDMLRLNPNDNQGIRYALAGFLLFLDQDDDLAKLLQKYADEDTAAWAYTKALLTFRQQGDTVKVRQVLKQARKTNKHVPAYLLGEKIAPVHLPDYYGFGDENEAMIYVGSFLVGWKSTPGAIAWLRANGPKLKKAKEAPPPEGPNESVIKSLTKKLPQKTDVWQIDFKQMPNWMKIAGQMTRPWVVLSMSRTLDLVLGHEMLEEVPSPAHLWDSLVQAMQHPAGAEAHRPTELHVRPHQQWDALKPHLDALGVKLELCEELDFFDFIFNEMTEHVGGKARPGLLAMPGVTAEQAGRFYAAAAWFFQQAPWKKVGFEAALKIECAKYQNGPWYAVLMGQAGLTTGLALYEDLNAIRQILAPNSDNEENARETVGISVTYGEEWEIPVADLEACKKYGWQVARPDAFPEIFRKERGMSVRPPLQWELELVEGCLRAVPDFVKRHKQDDPAKEEMTIQVGSGEMGMTLSWVVD